MNGFGSEHNEQRKASQPPVSRAETAEQLAAETAVVRAQTARRLWRKADSLFVALKVAEHDTETRPPHICVDRAGELASKLSQHASETTTGAAVSVASAFAGNGPELLHYFALLTK